jgi:hypothetical protein
MLCLPDRTSLENNTGPQSRQEHLTFQAASRDPMEATSLDDSPYNHRYWNLEIRQRN